MNIYHPGDTVRQSVRCTTENITAIAAGVYRVNGSATTAPTLTVGTLPAQDVSVSYVLSSGYSAGNNPNSPTLSSNGY